MTKKALKQKIAEVQAMGEIELNLFEEKLCVSDLDNSSKDELFKVINTRRERNRNIADAMVKMEQFRDTDECEL